MDSSFLISLYYYMYDLQTAPHEQAWVKETLNEVRRKLLVAERMKDEMASEMKSLQVVKSKLESR